MSAKKISAVEKRRLAELYKKNARKADTDREEKRQAYKRLLSLANAVARDEVSRQEQEISKLKQRIQLQDKVVRGLTMVRLAPEAVRYRKFQAFTIAILFAVTV